MEVITQSPVSPTSSVSRQEIDLTNSPIPPLEHEKSTSLAETGAIKGFGEKGASSSLLNDEMEAEQPPENRESARTEDRETEPTAENQDELTQKNVEAIAEKSLNISEKSAESASEKSDEPNS